MPELPEVETVVRGLRRTVLNQIVESVYFKPPLIARKYFDGDLNRLVGRRFSDIRRRGKNILIEFDDSQLLWVHLKMTGHFYYLPREDAIDKHDHLIFYLKENKHSLRFNDYRRFGNIRLLKSDEISTQKEIEELGPEPLEISRDDFMKFLDTHPRTAFKFFTPIIRVFSKRLRSNNEHFRDLLIWYLKKEAKPS